MSSPSFLDFLSPSLPLQWCYLRLVCIIYTQNPLFPLFIYCLEARHKLSIFKEAGLCGFTDRRSRNQTLMHVHVFT